MPVDTQSSYEGKRRPHESDHRGHQGDVESHGHDASAGLVTAIHRVEGTESIKKASTVADQWQTNGVRFPWFNSSKCRCLAKKRKRWVVRWHP